LIIDDGAKKMAHKSMWAASLIDLPTATGRPA
jgi:hypothetical protein